MNVHKLFSYLVLLLFSLSIAHSVSQSDDLKFLDFYLENESNIYKISYEINSFEKFLPTDKFILKVYRDDELTTDNCEYELDFSDETFYRQLTCEIQNLGQGNYVFLASIVRGGEIIEDVVSRQSIFDGVKTNIEFRNYGDSATIFLTVDGVGENLRIVNTLPKEVIEILNDENKNELIESDFDYKILEEDPIIAWSVDKAPAKINYTIKSKVKDSDLERIEIDVTTNPSFKYLIYLVYILIIVIVFKTLKPAFKKKK